MTPLRQRMIEDMQVRNLSENTQRSYLEHVARFAAFFQRSPDQLGPDEIRTYQVHLTTERRLAPGSLSVLSAALRFVYHVTLRREWVDAEIPRPKVPFQLPVILSREEVARFLDAIASQKHRTLLMTAYAAGLRVTEATRLKITDIDSQRMMIRVEQGKVKRTDTSCSRHRCSNLFGSTGNRPTPRSSCFRATFPATRLPVLPWSKPAERLSSHPGSRSRSHLIRYDIVSRHTCSNRALMSVGSNS